MSCGERVRMGKPQHDKCQEGRSGALMSCDQPIMPIKVKSLYLMVAFLLFPNKTWYCIYSVWIYIFSCYEQVWCHCPLMIKVAAGSLNRWNPKSSCWYIQNQLCQEPGPGQWRFFLCSPCQSQPISLANNCDASVTRSSRWKSPSEMLSIHLFLGFGHGPWG